MKKKYIPYIISLIIIIILFSVFVGRNIIAGKEPTLGSFGVVNFLGYLFFLTLPVEALIPYYLNLGYAPLVIGLVAVFTAIVSQSIDYLIGYLVPHNKMKELLGEKKYERAIKRIHNHGNSVIFIFNLLPLSSPIIVLGAGITGFKFKNTLIFSFIGLFIKYSFIIAIFAL